MTRTTPVFTGNLALQNAIAGSVVGGSLHLFTYVCYACGLLLVGTNALLLRYSHRRWAEAGMMTASLLLITALYLCFFLTPAMDAAQTSGQMSAFDRMHHRYEQISSTVQLPLLLLMALFAGLRDTQGGKA